MSLVIRLALIVVSSVIFFGLSIFAYGGLGPFLAQAALVAVMAVTAVAAVASLFTAGNVSTGVREDRGNRWVLSAFTLLGVLLALLPPYADSHDVWIVTWAPVRWVGVALFVVGCILRLWPVFVLGRRFSGLVAIQPGHTLVTTGVYGLVRNPSYLGMLMFLVGWSLAFRTWTGIALTALLLVPLVARIRAEEALLGSQFGEAWTAYAARTWRLVPWIY
jgi:protein-S-isoprenylcysteine O-methyltransferase Ste14